MAIHAACERCGDAFTTSPGEVARGLGRFCSRACANATTHKRGPANPNWKQEPHTCAHCGVSFTRPPCKLGKYCSQACQRADKAREIRHCERCGKELTQPQKRFCSPHCSAQILFRKPIELQALTLRTCEICGVVFSAKNATVRYGQARFCSRDCFAKWKGQEASVSHSRARGGRREDLDNRYFRSRWEANYARYLNWLVAQGQIKGWRYECITFEFEGIKRGVRFYTPDFEITELDDSIDFHEIKGWMDTKSATKLARMAKYHPAVRVIVIGEKEYTAIARQMKHMLGGWEFDNGKAA